MAEEAEHRIVREVDPKSVPGTPGFLEAEKKADAVGDALRATARGEFGPTSAANGSAADIPNTHGERPFVELKLEDGRTITLAQPPVSVAFILARILGPQDASNPLSVGYAKTLMYVAEIDGQVVPRPSNMAELQNLANIIGDRNLDLVSMEFGRYWPQMTELPVVKKNL